MKFPAPFKVIAGSAVLILGSAILAYPSVFPTGTTIYHPDKTWSGYTILDTADQNGAVLIDMNGNIVRRWPQLAGMGPFRILPGGYVLGADKNRRPHQETLALTQLDWDNEVVWKFDHLDLVRMGNTEDDDGNEVLGDMVWSGRHHHDWQREGSSVGYYSPEQSPRVDGGKTMILAHKNVTVPEISDKRLEDDYIYEINWEGEIVWEWLASDHVDELGFSEDARNAIYRSVGFNEARQSADWLHINAATYLGPNKWYDAGDERFNPENIMISSRTAQHHRHYRA